MDVVELWKIYWPQWSDRTKLATGFVMAFVVAMSVERLLRKKWTIPQGILWIILGGYLNVVYMSTVFARQDYGVYDYELKLFWTIDVIRATHSREMIRECVLNVLMLSPIGLIGPALIDGKHERKRYWKRVVMPIVLGTLVSFSIEFLQLILQRGLFEWDDMIYNVGGVILGVIFNRIVLKITRINKIFL